MRKTSLLLLLAVLFSGTVSLAQQSPKREFRGAWIQCVNNQFNGIGRDRMQATLTQQLDELQRDGINAIMFQVRAEGDALYQSSIEPWSRYLTGVQGNAPVPYWDPLEWMVEQCHLRGMECHAWINPFRAKTKGTTALASNHPYMQHPERFFQYDGLLLFDPGLPENRNYICEVVRDIVSRYDIDGVHIDDYFYPYPVAGVPIPDDASYQMYGQGMDRGDWRRENVNRFVYQMNLAIKSIKPWCKFGVSPFGIYHNEGSRLSAQSSQPRVPGSATKGGTQNYDDLYADVLKWIDEGWVDYNIPQIYWQIGHPAADYDTLIRWWSQYAGKRPLYIGQDVERAIKYKDLNDPSQDQMAAKYQLQRTLPGILGSCQWYAKVVADNVGNYGTRLREQYHEHPALQPLMPWISRKAPGKPRTPQISSSDNGPVLSWSAPKSKKGAEVAWYAVYSFASGEKINLSDASHLLLVTKSQSIYLPTNAFGTTYVITALSHLHNESKPLKVKL